MLVESEPGVRAGVIRTARTLFDGTVYPRRV
jgi:2-methylaconitate cis-trans-isomerase PrpF